MSGSSYTYCYHMFPRQTSGSHPAAKSQKNNNKKSPPLALTGLWSVQHVTLTVLAKAQRLPLPPLHNSADGSHPSVDEQHSQRGVQKEVN